MTDSIFDPTGDQTAHTGSRFSPQDAKQNSKMPPNLIDGEVEEEEEQSDPRDPKDRPPEGDVDR